MQSITHLVVSVVGLITILCISPVLSQNTFGTLWESSFGLLDIQQDGRQISGVYHCCGVGHIEGQIDGNRVRFTWQDEVFGKGWGEFIMTADGERLNGVWGLESDTLP